MNRDSNKKRVLGSKIHKRINIGLFKLINIYVAWYTILLQNHRKIKLSIHFSFSS